MHTKRQYMVMSLVVAGIVILIGTLAIYGQGVASTVGLGKPKPAPSPTDPLAGLEREEKFIVNSVTDGDTISGILVPSSEAKIRIQEFESQSESNSEKVLTAEEMKLFENLQGIEVKLAGIDAYEYSGSPGHDLGNCAGTAALAGLTVFLEKGPQLSDGWKDVVLVRDPSQSDRDKNGRLVRYVFLKDGTDINKKMILEGLAVNWDGNHARSKEFEGAEKTGQNSERAKRIKRECEQNPRQTVDWRTGFRNEADFMKPDATPK